jgi:hypothetical protein
MKDLAKYLLYLLVFVGGPFLIAQIQDPNFPRDITLTWTNPTEYVDGTLIEVGDLAGTKIVCARQDGTVAIDELVPITAGPGGVEGKAFLDLIPKPGRYTCNAFAITVEDFSSDASNDSVKKYTGKPKPGTISQ